MSKKLAWSCDERDRKECRNAHGCHCREITDLLHGQSADIKDWQDSSEAYRADFEQTQIVLRSVIESYDCNGDLNGAIDVARHMLAPTTLLDRGGK